VNRERTEKGRKGGGSRPGGRRWGQKQEQMKREVEDGKRGWSEERLEGKLGCIGKE